MMIRTQETQHDYTVRTLRSMDQTHNNPLLRTLRSEGMKRMSKRTLLSHGQKKSSETKHSDMKTTAHYVLRVSNIQYNEVTKVTKIVDLWVQNELTSSLGSISCTSMSKRIMRIPGE